MRSTWRRLTTRAGAVVVGMLVGFTGRTHAQTVDCGEYCGPCGTGKKEGWGWSASGDYDMRCIETQGGCPTAGCGAGSLVSDVRVSSSLLAKLSSASTSQAAWQTIPGMRERLLVYPARNMVALRGDRCAANSIVAVVFLSPARVADLAKRGVPLLEKFLQTQLSKS
jgi:hypothetical protein